MAMPRMAMFGAPVFIPGAAAWGADAFLLPAYHHAHGLLRLIESTYPAEELLHAWHVEALQRPELAGEPAMERFTAEATRALHDKMAAAGWARRILSGDIRPEAFRLLAESVRSFTIAQSRAGAALRELAARPAAARSPEVRAMRQVYLHMQPGARAIASATRLLLGTDPDPEADWDLPEPE